MGKIVQLQDGLFDSLNMSEDELLAEITKAVQATAIAVGFEVTKAAMLQQHDYEAQELAA